ncbi:MAG: metal ABC transporter ATP-binding protein [Parachlamydiaceae bacterium]|nr:metal ABC transporter ATP-binding protein [Parachlamydiaceae bacterium]
MDNTNPNPICCENLSFAYDDTSILKNISFTIYPGESVGIIGPNGGGKTTLLKLIMGFLKPTTGKISLFGSSPQQAINEIGYVPQVMRFDRQFPISVYELALSGRLSRLPWYGVYNKEDHQITNDILENLELTPFKHCAFGTLSGGQAQRVLIARALVSQPKLLLLDEPTANVDVKAEAKIYELLKELRGKITIVMVTHDLSTAIDQVQRVLCVQKTLLSLLPEEVCEHFALGLYHKPLINLDKKL